MRLRPPTTAASLSGAAAVSFVLALVGCTDQRVIGEGQFGRSIPLASDPASPLPRLAWRDESACPGSAGGCTSFCAGPPSECPADSCMPLLIDSGTALSILPGDGWSVSRECIEVRAAGGLEIDPATPESLSAANARFRFREAPVVRAPRDDVEGWGWLAGDDRNPIQVGGVIGGNVLRDFAAELRHRSGETPTVTFYSSFPGSERVLADQGRAYLRLQYPGRLLGRLLTDHCEIGPGVDCKLNGVDFDPDEQELIYESSRALVDACVGPPPCALAYDEDGGTCQLVRGGASSEGCAGEVGSSATFLIATGVPGLVIFEDSLPLLVGEIEQLPDCGAVAPDSTARACREPELGELRLPGWPPLVDLQRIRVRSLGLLQGLDEASGTSPCDRLRQRLRGLRHTCRGFAAEGRPVRPSAGTGERIAESAFVIGEVSWDEDQAAPDPERWLPTLVVPASAPPVIALRREVTPSGAQPDGMVGSALLRETEVVLDFTEALEKPGIRARCLDPGVDCLSLPACSADLDQVEFEGAKGGRTSCCYGLPSDLIAEVVLSGLGKAAPRVEDACCAALPPAALLDLQQLDLCEGVDVP
ncbi:hypothetical protein ACNOYE_40055 [Nannocystaceae bacterium ST9]